MLSAGTVDPTQLELPYQLCFDFFKTLRLLAHCCKGIAHDLTNCKILHGRSELPVLLLVLVYAGDAHRQQAVFSLLKLRTRAAELHHIPLGVLDAGSLYSCRVFHIRSIIRLSTSSRWLWIINWSRFCCWQEKLPLKLRWH